MTIHDANDMQNHKLGDAMFDEDDIFSPQVWWASLLWWKHAPIYDDYGDDIYAILNNDNHETCHHDFNFHSHDSYFCWVCSHYYWWEEICLCGE